MGTYLGFMWAICGQTAKNRAKKPVCPQKRRKPVWLCGFSGLEVIFFVGKSFCMVFDMQN